MSLFVDFDHLRIPLEDIIQATNNFSDQSLIGRGDFGRRYKGELLRPEGIVTCAFERLDQAAAVQINREFWKEIVMLSRYTHKNILPLVGFCKESAEQILVHEFQTRGSLDKYVSSSTLTWLKRLQICLGAAQGLNYLHDPQHPQQRVFHRDMKSANILLDKNWQAKIANFGLSKIGLAANQQYTFLISHAVGSIGYVDPLYRETGFLSKESDVYSFGMVLFEVLCGRLATTTDEETGKFLGALARQHYEEGTITNIIDPLLRKQMNPDSMKNFSTIAYQCLENDRSKRPRMIEIVERLQEALDLQLEYEKAVALQQVADDLKAKGDAEDDSYKVKNMEHMKIPFEDINLATHEFREDLSIGRGGFGKVYKAVLFHFDVKKYIRKNRSQAGSMEELSNYPRKQSTVAIKRLDRTYGQGTAEFLQEISILPYFRHQNLVTLVGFCDENHERILVYEYASKRSLDEYLGSTNHTISLGWTKRLQICLDAAHGLNFLHNGVGEHHRIIHRDVKTSNILLDQNWKGMISDFGLSRIGPANLQATFVMTQVAGTLEYIDPQYHKTGMLTKESDVYSFGVVLFEVLSGRLARFPKSKDDLPFLPHMAKRCFEQKKVHEIIDPKLKKEFENANSPVLNIETCPDSINIFAAIAYQCFQEKREDRPTMADVVKELDKAFNSHVKGVEALRTPLDTIRFAANEFNTAFEQGAFGKVYKGKLSCSKGYNSVKIMQLDPSHMVDMYGKEFRKEIAKLHSYRHMNIVPLVGFCEESSERIVIFEDMVNGNLNQHLKNTSLTWKERLKICVDAAHGLAYIHSIFETRHSIHGDIKSSSILLNHDWKAVISDFIISKGSATLGYYDQLYPKTGILVQKSDVYSFGVVLFEILSGRLAIETFKKDDMLLLGDVPDGGPDQNHGRGVGESGQVIFLARLAAQCFKDRSLEKIIFHDIKGQIEKKSLDIFSAIAYRCLQEQLEDRPTMAEVVQELQKAFECQDEWEWEQKLPKDYEKIIDKSKSMVSSKIKKKDLHSLLTSGILLKEEVWFSLSKDGANNEMISAKKFSYKNLVSLKWRSISNSRFLKVAKMSDTSNLNIHIQIRTQFLSPGTIYGAYLVFKYCDQRKVSGGPLHVNLKYKTASGTSNAYVAEWIDEEWMRIELNRFMNHNQSFDFEILLKSFSSYSCSTPTIFIEGVAFQAIENMDHKEKMDEGTLNTDLEINYGKQLPSVIEEIIERSKEKVPDITKEELYKLLSKGILIDNAKKLFSLCKANGKICHMLPAKEVIYNPPNVKCSNCKRSQRSRFSDVVELQSHQAFRITCNIETQMLSPNTRYACYLVFELPENSMGLKSPVKAQNLLAKNNKDATFFYLTSPSPVNLHRDKRVPKQREDGWMEVVVWEFLSYNEHNDDHHPMDLKLVCLEGSMSGLIIGGVEFRPT